MYGISRDTAADALGCGWRKDCLMLLHQTSQDVQIRVSEFLGWAIAFEDAFLVYKSFGPSEIESAFGGLLGEEITAYCDGSGTTGDKPAGIGCVIYRPDEAPLMYAENIGKGTNNRAELCAVWRALRATPDCTQRMLVKTDSEYTIGALTKDWARNVNAELITNIRTDLDFRRGNVRFEHVDGHAGHEGNETADRLAYIGRKLVTKVSEY